MRLRHWLVLLILIPFVFSGCATAKAWWQGDPNTATRFLADIGCVTALASAAVQVSGDPMVNGAKTALGVLTAISTLGASNIPATVLAACASTLALAPQDADGARAVAEATPGTELPKASVPKMAGSPPAQPAGVQPVVIPLPKKGK